MSDKIDENQMLEDFLVLDKIRENYFNSNPKEVIFFVSSEEWASVMRTYGPEQEIKKHGLCIEIPLMEKRGSIPVFSSLLLKCRKD